MFFEEVKRTEGSHDEKKHARRPPLSNRPGVVARGWGSSMIATYLLVLRKAASLVEIRR